MVTSKVDTSNTYDIMSSMDYILGFLLGYFIKETLEFIKRISEKDWGNHTYTKEDWDWISHEDLP